MSTIIDFLKKSKIPFLWTIGYVFVTWGLLHLLFNFELFSRADWIHISHAHLHGFGGFAFSLIILAAVPLYIATTTIVIRTQKPLLALPVPKFIFKIMEKLFPKQTKIEEEKKQEEKTDKSTETPTNEEQDKFPAEMRGAFFYTRTHPQLSSTPICSACSVNPNVYPNNTQTPSQPCDVHNDLPLPPDFDFDDSTDYDTPSAPSSVPVFQDINFYNDDNDNNDNQTTTPDKQNESDNTNPVIEYLNKNNRKFTTSDNDIIITDSAAIVVHNDSDFWIMDEPTWFAAGKTRESPIQKLLDLAQKNNIQPILYLGETNIMNFDEKQQEWKNNGIRIITKLTDL